jgi:hypothetical protein
MNADASDGKKNSKMMNIFFMQYYTPFQEDGPAMNMGL